MSNSFAGKVVILTGAAQGIGLATAHLLASRGACLSIADIQEEALQKAQAEIKAAHNVDVISCVVDVRKGSDVNAWVKKTMDHFGHFEGAANIAGVVGKQAGITGIVDQDEDEWDFTIAVNLTGVMHCLRAQMRDITKGGSIVNAASVAGLVGRPNLAAYSASKHGVIGLSRSAAKEIGKDKTRVNSIAPGPITTPLNQQAHEINPKTMGAGSPASQAAIVRQGTPEECASLIAFLLSDESKYITGATYSIDGGWFC